MATSKTVKVLSPISILNDYFNKDASGSRPLKLQDFKAEVDQLSPEDKAELVALAAEDMGVTVK